jgi:hypothetical protein
VQGEPRKRRRYRKRRRAARKEAGELGPVGADELELARAQAELAALRSARGDLLTPGVTLGVSPLAPAELPPPASSTSDESSDVGASDGEDDAQSAASDAPPLDEPALTPEWLVDTCEELQVSIGLVYCIGTKREWTPKAQAAATYSQEQKARLLVFAPQALPYVAPWLKNQQLIGCGLFALGVIRSTAEMFGRLRELPQVAPEAPADGAEPAYSTNGADVGTSPRWSGTPGE